MKLEKIILGCAVGILGAAMYIASLTTGYAVSNYHKIKALDYAYEAVKSSYNSMNKEEREKYAELYRIHNQKSEKWKELTRAIDLFHKLNLYH